MAASLRDRVLLFAETRKWSDGSAGSAGSADTVKCRKATRRALAEIRAGQAIGIADPQLCRYFQRRERAMRHELSALDDRLVTQVTMLLSSDADAALGAACLAALGPIVRERGRLEEILLALQTLVAQLGGAECRTTTMRLDGERLLRQCTRCLADEKDGSSGTEA